MDVPHKNHKNSIEIIQKIVKNAVLLSMCLFWSTWLLSMYCLNIFPSISLLLLFLHQTLCPGRSRVDPSLNRATQRLRLLPRPPPRPPPPPQRHSARRPRPWTVSFQSTWKQKYFILSRSGISDCEVSYCLPELPSAPLSLSASMGEWQRAQSSPWKQTCQNLVHLCTVMHFGIDARVENCVVVLAICFCANQDERKEKTTATDRFPLAMEASQVFMREYLHTARGCSFGKRL